MASGGDIDEDDGRSGSGISTDLLANCLSEITTRINDYRQSARFWLVMCVISTVLFWTSYLFGHLFFEPNPLAPHPLASLVFFAFGLSQIISGIILPLTWLESEYAWNDYSRAWHDAKATQTLPQEWLADRDLLAPPTRTLPRYVAYPMCMVGGLVSSLFITFLIPLMVLTACFGQFK